MPLFFLENGKRRTLVVVSDETKENWASKRKTIFAFSRKENKLFF